MWQNTGIVREERCLAEADGQIRDWLARTPVASTRRQHEYRSSLVLGLLLTNAARLRKESRGAHYRQDFPDPNDVVASPHRYLSGSARQWLELYACES